MIDVAKEDQLFFYAKHIIQIYICIFDLILTLAQNDPMIRIQNLQNNPNHELGSSSKVLDDPILDCMW